MAEISCDLQKWWLHQIHPCTFQSIGPLGRCFLLVNFSVCVCVCPSVHLLRYHFNIFFPTFQRPISKDFTGLEFFGESNGMKWSQIRKLLLVKGVKLQRNKKVCLTKNKFFGNSVFHSVYRSF